MPTSRSSCQVLTKSIISVYIDKCTYLICRFVWFSAGCMNTHVCKLYFCVHIEAVLSVGEIVFFVHVEAILPVGVHVEALLSVGETVFCVHVEAILPVGEIVLCG